MHGVVEKYGNFVIKRLSDYNVKGFNWFACTYMIILTTYGRNYENRFLKYRKMRQKLLVYHVCCI